MQADTNYIYILLVVVYVIYSIIKAGKKVTKNRPTINQQPQSSPTVSPSHPPPKQEREDDFKKMLEDLLGGAPEVGIPEKQVSIPKPEPAKMAPPLPKREKKSSPPPKLSLQKKTKTAEPASILSHEGGKKIPKAPEEVAVAEEESQVEFDIREAIIYSEILKRPQY